MIGNILNKGKRVVVFVATDVRPTFITELAEDILNGGNQLFVAPLPRKTRY